LEPRRTPSVSFAVQKTFAVGNAAYSAVVGDLNGDGRPDLVLANYTDNTVSVLINTTAAGSSTPSFAARQTFAVPLPAAVAVADINGDGRPDLVISDGIAEKVTVLLNMTPGGSGTVSFAAPQTFAVGSPAGDVAVGDFNGDGRPDLAVIDSGDNTVSVLLNTTPAGAGTATFAAQQTFAAGSSPDTLAVTDFSGDGRPDVVIANSGGADTVSVLLNTTPAGATTPSFAPLRTFAASDPSDVTVGDFNGDGRPDLAFAVSGSNAVGVLMNKTPAGAATLSFSSQQTFAVGSVPLALTVGDFNGDGRPDLGSVNYQGNSVSVLLNTTSAGAMSPAFAAQQTFAVGSFPRVAVTGDFNGDGRTDLAVGNIQDKTVSVLSNTTTAFSSTVPVVVGQFGSQGVWEFNRSLNTWVQLTPANASLLVADPQGDVVGEFPGHGVWLYRPAAGWGNSAINGVDATALAMDMQGDIAAEFPGYGVGEYLPAAGWRSLTPSNATLLAMDASGDVAGEFPGYGVQLFRPASGWQQINGVDATLLAMDALGDVAANFPGVGLGEYRPASAGWQVLNGVQAQALAVDALGDVAAQFQGYGVGAYLPAAGWRNLTASNAAVLAMVAGDVMAEFPGYGVWEFDQYRGWYQLTAADALALTVA
jgi:hypothetical protein